MEDTAIGLSTGSPSTTDGPVTDPDVLAIGVIHCSIYLHVQAFQQYTAFISAERI